MAAKRLEILMEALPRVSRVAVFHDPSFPGELPELQRAAKSQAVRLEVITMEGPQDFEAAFNAVKRKKVGAVMLSWSAIWYVHRTRVAALALHARVPLVSPFSLAVDAGALMSYGPDLDIRLSRGAYYLDRLLKGTKPSDLPVEQVSKLKLAINLNTARALGVAIPESILLRADQVVR